MVFSCWLCSIMTIAIAEILYWVSISFFLPLKKKWILWVGSYECGQLTPPYNSPHNKTTSSQSAILHTVPWSMQKFLSTCTSHGNWGRVTIALSLTIHTNISTFLDPPGSKEATLHGGLRIPIRITAKASFFSTQPTSLYLQLSAQSWKLWPMPLLLCFFLYITFLLLSTFPMWKVGGRKARLSLNFLSGRSFPYIISDSFSVSYWSKFHCKFHPTPLKGEKG